MMLENILADFELLDDWEDRYRYVIELGRSLPPLPEAARAEAKPATITCSPPARTATSSRCTTNAVVLCRNGWHPAFAPWSRV
jgi:hypothetical protein